MLDRFVQLIKNGEVVAFPTETVYGLGADAWNRDAVQKVFDIKGRPADNPLIVHISDYRTAEDFAANITDDARALMQQFWPGPLTLIFKKKNEVLDIVTAGLDTVALRWPKHPLSQELIALAGPLVAPSANSSGRPSPTKAGHVREDFGEYFPVIDAGETEIGLESTVLDISEEPYRIYRPGAIGAQQIEDITGKKVSIGANISKDESAKSPGTKYSHYAPEANVHWLDEEPDPDKKDTLYLLHSKRYDREADNIILYHGDLGQMAHELYDRFRQADLEDYTSIAIEPFSGSDVVSEKLVPALQNRIGKALSQ